MVQHYWMLCEGWLLLARIASICVYLEVVCDRLIHIECIFNIISSG